MAASLDRVPFKEEGQRLESPPGYTTSWILPLVAVRFSLRALLCCEGHFSTGRFSFRASRDAVNGEGTRRRSLDGRVFVYRSTIRPVVHPPSAIRSQGNHARVATERSSRSCCTSHFPAFGTLLRVCRSTANSRMTAHESHEAASLDLPFHRLVPFGTRADRRTVSR